MYSLFCDVPCIVCVYMCTEQLPPGGYPIAVKYIISYKTSHKCIMLFRTTFRTLVAFLFCDRHSCTSTKGTKSVLEKRRFSGFLSTRPAIHGNYIRKLLMNRPFLTECNTENFHITFLFSSYVALQLLYREFWPSQRTLSILGKSLPIWHF
jgi:hypothetical protein